MSTTPHLPKPSQQTLPPRERQIKLVEAKYTRDDVLSLYRGNPLIEALPAAPDMRELIQKLQCLPAYDREKDPQQSSPNRLEMLEGLRFFFQPLPRHFHLTQDIFSMIRSGYVGRCPSWGKPTISVPDPAMESAALIGPSGTGKSFSLRHELRLIDQVILHSNYCGRVVSETQVCWLRVECPHDASPRGLCCAIFEKLDAVLGTQYAREFGSDRSTANKMIPGVATLASLHYIGLLVIDEIQNLLNRKTRASVELLDFIVRIVNDFGVPVLMVGTSEAGDFLSKDFRVTRRTTGLLQPHWGRLVEDEHEWTLFTNALWKYQYVRSFTPLTSDLRHLIFELTQGIPDLVVKLYYLAQRHAINEGIEQITSNLLEKVNETSLVQNRAYLNILRSGKTPAEDFLVETIFSQDRRVTPVRDQSPSTLNQRVPLKKGKRSTNGGRSTLLSAILDKPLEGGASTYDVARTVGLIHSSDT